MVKEFRYDDVPVIETKSGKLKGYSFDHVYIFKGIPYAQAKRFQMPTEVDAWDGVKDVTTYGYVCPLMSQEKPSAELLVPHRYWPQDEHCQNLNIWTESLDTNAKKPVLVWLHGGGFVAGSSIEQEAYDGFNMCKEGDVVVVSVNHRLNILGYMDLSPFGEKYANSANAGHADLVAALKWINENISKFGGDPENVTLFGQSGGGMKVTGLMQIPSANGLFHKAIVMSGVSDGKLLPTPEGDGTKIVKALLDKLGLGENEVDRLETIPYQELVQAYKEVSPTVSQQGGYVGCGPMVNDFYLGEPLLTGFTEHAQSIPMLIGSVYGEFAFAPLPFNRATLTDEEMKEILTKKFGEQTEELIALFKAAYPDKKAIDLLTLDRVFRKPHKDLAKLQAQHQQAPAYLYNFTFEFPYQNGKTAWHCSDIPFVFHNANKVEICNVPGVSDKLEKQVFMAFIQFARTGNPNHKDLPHWPAVTTEDEPTMIFDRSCEVRHNYDDALLAKLPPFSLAELFSQDIQH